MLLHQSDGQELLTDLIPQGGLCGLTSVERQEALRRIQTAVDCQSNGIEVPECGPGLWIPIADFNVTGDSRECPTGWTFTETPARGCTRGADSAGCDLASFSTEGCSYQRVCGRVIGSASGSMSLEGFNTWPGTPIDGINLVDGVTITHSSPIQHIWTLAGSSGMPSCPCNVPSTITTATTFAGSDYFCDTTSADTKQLWAGDCQGLSPAVEACCNFNTPPFFTATLPSPTSANVDARLCRDEPRSNEDLLVEIIQLYVQ